MTSAPIDPIEQRIEAARQRVLAKRAADEGRQKGLAAPPSTEKGAAYEAIAAAGRKRAVAQIGQELAQAAGGVQQSIGALPRFLAQLTSDPDARLRFLQDRFGQENVGIDPQSSQTFIRTDDGVRVLDPSFSNISLTEALRDVGDVAGEIVEGVGGALGAAGAAAATSATGPGAVLAGSAGAAAGAGAARAGIESAFEFLTGSDSDVIGESAMAAAFGAGGETIARGLGAALRAGGRVASRLNTALRQRFADQAAAALADFEKITNLPATTAPATQVRASRAAARAINKRVEGLYSRLAAGPGKDIQDAIEKAGDAGRVTPAKAIAVYDEWISRYADTPIGDAKNRAVKSLQKQRDALASNQDGLTLQQVQNSLEQISRAQRGDEALVKGLKRSRTDRKIATQLHEALVQDLEESAADGAVPASVAEEYQLARAMYREMMQKINSVEKQGFKKVAKLTAEERFEDIPKLFTRQRAGFGPENARKVASYLAETDPQAYASLQQAVLGDLLNAATDAGSFVPEKFANVLRGDQGLKLQALFEGSPEALAQVSALQRVGAKLARRQRSSFAPLTETLKTLHDFLVPELEENAGQGIARLLSSAGGRESAIRYVGNVAENRTISAELRRALLRQALPFAAGAAGEEPRE